MSKIGYLCTILKLIYGAISFKVTRTYAFFTCNECKLCLKFQKNCFISVVFIYWLAIHFTRDTHNISFITILIFLKKSLKILLKNFGRIFWGNIMFQQIWMILQMKHKVTFNEMMKSVLRLTWKKMDKMRSGMLSRTNFLDGYQLLGFFSPHRLAFLWMFWLLKDTKQLIAV